MTGWSMLAVVGLGAMGGYMAARMLAAGFAPTALVTSRHPSSVS